MIPWWRTELGDEEIRAVEQVIRQRHINQGPVCQQFEQQLAKQLGVPFVTTCSSGSAALYMALAACGVKAGDEVIVPAMTYIATAHAVLLCGASVRLVDVQPDRPLINVDLIETAINQRTRAIVPVHLNGGACEMAKINAIARRHGLKVVEDSAQAFASKGPCGVLGAQGDASAFSLSIAKLITTGEGGFVATADAPTYEKLLKLRNQGVLNVSDNVFSEFGFNFRLNDILASIGLAQLEALPQKIANALCTHRFYRTALEQLGFLRVMPYNLDGGELPLWTQVFCADRQQVVQLLEARGITTRPMNPPLSESPQLHQQGEFPHARRWAAGMLGLPCGPSQHAQDLQRVVDAMYEIRDQVAPIR